MAGQQGDVCPVSSEGLERRLEQEPFTHAGLPYQAECCDPQATGLQVAVEGTAVGTLGKDYSGE